MEQHTATTPAHCATCDVVLQGKFCHDCGEKKLDPMHDFSIKHFLSETFENFVHLDSKLLRSFWLLFSKPGFLTAEFIAGRRVRYFKPIPMFVIAGVLFYFFLSKATAFYSNLGDMSKGYQEGNILSNTFHVNTELLFSNKVAEVNLDAEAYFEQISIDAANRSKTWLFLVVPVWGMLLWLMFYRTYKWVVPHLIFALHGFTFFVLFDMLCLVFLRFVLHLSQVGDWFSLFLAICLSIYNMLAVRQVYGLGRLPSIFAGIGSMLIFLLILILYRQSMLIWTLYSL